MSAPPGVLRRIEGEGWVVLAGGSPSLGRAHPRLAERLVEHIDLSQPGVVLTAGPPTPEREQFVDDVDVLLDSNLEVHELSDVAGAPELGGGLVALLGGSASEWLAACDTGGLDESLLHSLSQGGLVLASQSACACFGSWSLRDNGDGVAPALAWLPGAIVVPGRDDPAERPDVRRVLSERDHCYALGLTGHSILALGPRGQVEVWGESAPKVTLGRGWG